MTKKEFDINIDSKQVDNTVSKMKKRSSRARSFYLRDDIYEKLCKMADEKGCAPSVLVTAILLEALKDEDED